MLRQAPCYGCSLRPCSSCLVTMITLRKRTHNFQRHWNRCTVPVTTAQVLGFYMNCHDGYRDRIPIMFSWLRGMPQFAFCKHNKLWPSFAQVAYQHDKTILCNSFVFVIKFIAPVISTAACTLYSNNMCSTTTATLYRCHSTVMVERSPAKSCMTNSPVAFSALACCASM